MRSIANRDHKGNSLIDDRKRQDEAKPLIPFFDTDYELHDRLIYALDGVEWTGADEDEEQFDISRQQKQVRWKNNIFKINYYFSRNENWICSRHQTAQATRE